MVPEFENVTCKANQTKNLGLTDQKKIPFTYCNKDKTISLSFSFHNCKGYF